jgi:hypothetical protein
LAIGKPGNQKNREGCQFAHLAILAVFGADDADAEP